MNSDRQGSLEEGWSDQEDYEEWFENPEALHDRHDPWEPAATQLRQTRAAASSDHTPATRSYGPARQHASGSREPEGQVYAQQQLGIQRRVIHDQPPIWDGKNPETQAQTYLKASAIWLATTHTLPKQQGWIIMQHSDNDLKTIISDLDFETLTAENSGQIVYDLIQKTFTDYVEKKLPVATEKCLFSQDGKRRKGENMILYTQRKD